MITAGTLLMKVAAGSVVMISIGSALLLRHQQKAASRQRREEERQRYLAHLHACQTRLEAAANSQLESAASGNPPPDKLIEAVMTRQRVWERRRDDADFLTCRLGSGRVESMLRPRLEVGIDPLGQHDPDLLVRATSLASRYEELDGFPILADLAAISAVAIAGSREARRGLARAVLCQLAAFHSPTDLRLITLTGEDGAEAWKWQRWLPHSRRARREIGNGPLGLIAAGSAAREGLFDEFLAPRLNGGIDVRLSQMPHLMVVLDDFTPEVGAALPGFEDLLRRGSERGVTIICLIDDRSHEPGTLSMRIALGSGGWVSQHGSGPGSPPREFGPDQLDLGAAEAIARGLAPLSLAETAGEIDLSRTVRLSRLLRQDDSPCHLRIPIGEGDGGQPVYLDLKEAAEGGMGPHGLLVGATGSGKSELLRTLVCGLAQTHRPDQVNFIFVDFKGGVSFAALAELPHSAGMITNLETDLSLVDRILAALHGEVDRRQRILRAAGNLEGIRQFQAVRAGGRTDLAPLPHLLIIVDEFGELLARRPDFLDFFVAVGRLGRSLGMHLLLSTQRLESGRIKGLESHLRYRIALRTFSADESQTVLGTTDAHRLPSYPGLGYLKVDSDVYRRFKSALVSIPVSEGNLIPPVPVVRRLDWSPPGDPTQSGVTEIEAIVGSSRIATDQAHQVWLNPLPKVLRMDEVDAPTEGGLRVALGVIDEPACQRQDALWLDFAGSGGHLAVVGSPRSGKSTLLVSIVTRLCLAHGPGAVNIYCADLGGGGLGRLASLPHVGAVCAHDDGENLRRLLRQVREAIDTRACSPEHKFPELFFVVDDCGRLLSEVEGADLDLVEIGSRGLNYGVHLVVAAQRWGDIKPKLRDQIGTRLELRLNDPAESELGRALARSIPAGIPGRGLTSSGLQFQVALAGEGEWEEIVSRGGAPAAPLRVLPGHVGVADLRIGADQAGVALGLSESALLPFHVDLLGRDPHFLILGDSESGKTTALRTVISSLMLKHPATELRISIIDYRRGLRELAEGPHAFGYACTEAGALELADHLWHEIEPRQLPHDLPDGVIGRAFPSGRTGNGPRHVLVVDDYDWVAGPARNPLASLTELLLQGSDTGFHVVLSRRVAGSGRAAFEPFLARIKELGGPALVLAGDPGEGPILGAVRARPQPPGRGLFVRRGLPAELVQVAISDAGIMRECALS
jgi:S-DNA-T family DNA segregation ATPase FtsK/SpoIIIE